MRRKTTWRKTTDWRRMRRSRRRRKRRRRTKRRAFVFPPPRRRRRRAPRNIHHRDESVHHFPRISHQHLSLFSRQVFVPFESSHHFLPDFFISLVAQSVQNLWKLSSGERRKRHKLPVDVRKSIFGFDVERLFYALDGVVVDDVPPIGGGVVRRRKGRKRRRRFGGDDHLLLSLIRLAPREEEF